MDDTQSSNDALQEGMTQGETPPTAFLSNDEKSEPMKDRLLRVSREKSYLETIILQQNDEIIRIGQEKTELSLSLHTLEETIDKIKKRLAELDILRNSEISELKKEMDLLRTENRKLISERELVFGNLEKQQDSPSHIEMRMQEALHREKLDIESVLEKARDELGLRAAHEAALLQGEASAEVADIVSLKSLLNEKMASLLLTLEVHEKNIVAGEIELRKSGDSLRLSVERLHTIEEELSALKLQLNAAELDRDKARTDLSSARGENAELSRDNVSLLSLVPERDAPPEEGEKVKLPRTVGEYQETFEHLKGEIISLNNKIDEQGKALDLLISEKQDLINKTSEYQQTISDLEQSNEEEILYLKDEIASNDKTISGLRLSLEQELSDNAELRARLQSAQETAGEEPQSFTEKPEETLPSRLQAVKKHKALQRRHVFAYIITVLITLAGTGIYFYAFDTDFSARQQQRPEPPVERKIELAYQDIFSILTKTSSANGIKFQATMITGPLIMKSESPEDKGLFDFQNFDYFKVSISSPAQGLGKDMAADPYSFVTLSTTAGRSDLMRSQPVKDVKTFYRREVPVSTTFYCAFPRNVNMPDYSLLTLSLRAGNGSINLTWALEPLRTSSLLR
jgi:hypothetical protein